jgi:hypothetical protein
MDLKTQIKLLSGILSGIIAAVLFAYVLDMSLLHAFLLVIALRSAV